jgi:glycosyltransferase involved in cell wall biosynthesis
MDGCYRQASVLVSAARMETYGMALQEARRYGLPILAHDGGNTRNHFEDGKNGHLYGAIDALADGCVALMRDGARARALFATAQAMRTDGSYTWQAAAASLVDQLDAWFDS